MSTTDRAKTAKKIASLTAMVLVGLLTVDRASGQRPPVAEPETRWQGRVGATPQHVDLSVSMTPVKSQGGRNTCNVFAATALMEYLIKVETDRELDLSESFNYLNGKTLALTSEYLRKMYSGMDGLAGFLAVEAYRHGSMLESEWPYEQQNWQQTGDPRCEMGDQGPSTRCFTGDLPEEAEVLEYRIVPEYVPRSEIGHYILTEQKPVIMNIFWCSTCADPSTGQVRMPTAAELALAQASRSGHVITLVGYDSQSRLFRFRNSYGPGWGNDGYGTIPEQYILEACELCPYLDRLPNYSPELRDFVKRGSMGVSGTLSW